MARNAATAVSVGASRVNLMPRSETIRRQRAALIRAWAWVLAAVLVLVLVLSAGAFWVKLTADQQLVAAQARTNELLSELAILSSISQALATQTELRGFQTEAMAADLAWTETLTALSSALPAGVSLTGFDLAAGGVPVAAPVDESAREPAADPAAAAVGLKGALTLESPTPIEIAPAVRALRAVNGVIDADARELTSAASGAGAGSFTYSLTVTLDQSIYTRAFAAEGNGS